MRRNNEAKQDANSGVHSCPPRLKPWATQSGDWPLTEHWRIGCGANTLEDPSR